MTITVKENGRLDRSMTLEFPSDLPLMETDDCWYTISKVFSTILFWMGYDEQSINHLFCDCEECDVITELNREHNAELNEQCENCRGKQLMDCGAIEKDDE